MIKEILKEYEALVLERKDLAKRIERMEQELKYYERCCCAQDRVKGGDGGAQRFTVRGFPLTEYRQKKTLLMSRKLSMEEMQKKIECRIGEVEACIDRVESPTMRMILRYRYLDGKSWEEVTKALGPGYSKDAVRKKCERFMGRK